MKCGKLTRLCEPNPIPPPIVLISLVHTKDATCDLFYTSDRRNKSETNLDSRLICPQISAVAYSNPWNQQEAQLCLTSHPYLCRNLLPSQQPHQVPKHSK